MKALNNAAIPAAIARMLRTPPLAPHQFTATKFHSAEDKAWFGNAFLKFLAADCPQSAFTKRFYNRLSNSFGHIAHYNRAGFYGHFFIDLAGKIDFLQQTLQWPCYGQPEHTFSDVELMLQARLSATTLLPILIARRDADIARRERDLLARLKTKYEPQPQPADAPAMPLRQASLFDLSA